MTAPADPPTAAPAPTAETVFAPVALLPEGWAADVRVAIGGDGRIASVTPDAAPGAGDTVLGPDRVLVPAPVDLHSHAFQRAMAGMTETRGGAGTDDFWSWRTLMYRFLARLTPDDVEAIAAMVQVEALEAGFGGICEFHYLHHGPDGTPYADPAEMAGRIAAAATETGIGLTLLPVLYRCAGLDGRPVEGAQRRFATTRDGYADLVAAAGGHVAALPADARLGVAPHSLRAAAMDEIVAVAGLLPDGPVHIHVAEQVAEVDAVVDATGARPVAHLLDRAPVDGRWCLIHATHMAPAETAALAATGAVAGLCPITEANLGDGVFDGARFLAAGGRFGVGSDANLRLDLAGELRLLEESQRLATRRRAVMAAEGRSVGRTLVEAAAAGGARAAGRPAGAIAAGRWADLLALDVSGATFEGLHGDAVLDAWLVAAGERCVDRVWSAGRAVVTGGRHPARPAVEARFRTVLRRLRDG